MLTSKTLTERNLAIYNAANGYLERIKPSEVILDNYFYGDDRNYTSLEEVFLRFIFSAQNYQRMPNVIAFTRREPEIREILQNYDLTKIASMSTENLYQTFRTHFKVTTADSKRNSWYKWSCSVIDSARYVNTFRSVEEFDDFVKRHDRTVETRIMVPLQIQSSIRGIGFALACDSLKELGYTNYIKPDVHMTDIFQELGLSDGKPVSTFKAVAQMAVDCQAAGLSVTPYQVDKVFWLICSGYYYKEEPPLRLKGQKHELMEYLKQI